MAKVELVDRDELAHMAKPSGWFQVGWSHEYETGTVRPLHYFGRELVAYRVESGRLVVADAFCPHFGAHLGHGGVVDGDCIVCPFHGWVWGPDGSNVAIPYSKVRNKSKRVHQFPVRERSGLIFLWHGDDEPWWEPPEVSELVDEDRYYGAYPDGTKVWEKARLFPQFVLENTVDLAHLKHVHRWLEVPEPEVMEAEEASFRSRFSGQIPTRKGTNEFTVDSVAYGVGLTVNRLLGVRDTVQVLAVTPVDDFHSDLLISCAVERLDPDGDAVPRVVRSIRRAQLVTAYEEDIPIWSNMKYNVTPPFPKEEARDFLRLRKWSERFYPEPPPYRYE